MIRTILIALVIAVFGCGRVHQDGADRGPFGSAASGRLPAAPETAPTPCVEEPVPTELPCPPKKNRH